MPTHTVAVHKTLARSYLIYFVASLLGLFADSFIHFNIPFQYWHIVTIICFALGPILVLWAQYTSRHFKKGNHPQGDGYFFHGPYRYLRNPTHLGLLILVTGYAVARGSLIFFSITFLGYCISSILFKRYESRIETLFGTHYAAYKESVRKIL